jgi:lysophospholipid acyltransferase (LPLAT)-like uncharacterized protein
MSWDRFLLPLPFSTGVFVFGEPIRVDRDVDREGLERKRVELERALIEATRQAGELVNRGRLR